MEYLLKSILCLMVFLAIHRLLLQREVFYQFNRFYLLGAVLFSFLIPLNTIEKVELVEREVPVLKESFEFKENFIPTIETESNLDTTYLESQSEFPWETLVWTLYGMILLVFLIRFIKNISILYDHVRRNLKVTYKGQTLVLMSQQVLPFTFFKYIFVNQDEFERNEFSDSVFEHELAHVEGKHSWDILLIELLLIPFWFHPGLYWAKQSVTLNHEFIADQSVLKNWPLHQYQSELLRYATFQSQNSLVSNLNFSLTKKRLEMMKKKTKPTIQVIKLLVLLPVLGMVIYGFSEKKIIKEDYLPIENATASSNDHNDPLFVIHGNSSFDFDGLVHPIDELANVLGEKNDFKSVNLIVERGVSSADIHKFQAVLEGLDIKKINYVEVNSHQARGEEQKAIAQRKGHAGSDEDFFRNAYFVIEDSLMNYTPKSYSELTEKQKMRLMRPKFNGDMAKSPSSEQFEKFKNKDAYAIWIDGKVMPNSELDQYTSADFYHFFDSFVYPNARSKRFPQEHQVHLYKKEYYLKIYGPDAEMFKPLTSNDTITLTSRGGTWHKDIQNFPDPTTKYLQVLAKYEKLRDDGVTYPSKSDQEKRELDEMYQQLKEKYFSSNSGWQKRVKKPIPPQGNS